ncbi:MAG: translation elongation factor Ts [Deltaproteobacteria bacterium]|nr:translation elongation factor Ts [Deltaproteobacteria bacterium]
MEITAAKVMELRNITGVGMMECKKALNETGGDLESASEYLRKKGMAVAAKKADRETNEGGVRIAVSPDKKTGAIVHLACETDFVSRNDQFQELLGKLANQALAQGETDLENQTLAGGGGKVSDLLTQSISTMGENLRLIGCQRVNLSGEGTIGGYVHSNGRIGVLVAVSSDKPCDGSLEELSRDLAMHIAASQVFSIDAEELDKAMVDKEREIVTAQAKESGKPDNVVEKMVEGRMNKFFKEVTLLHQPFVKNPDKTIAQVLEDFGKSKGVKVSVSRFVKLHF